MNITILDCYTDEPAGLGVPPYLGTYPRYLFGYLLGQDCTRVQYLTVDDLRVSRFGAKDDSLIREDQKTDIRTYNKTCFPEEEVEKLLRETDVLYVIIGIHVTGKYLSALPGTLKEIVPLIKDLTCRKILAGPAFYGTQLEGGKFFEKIDLSLFDEKQPLDFSLDEVEKIAVRGTAILEQIRDVRMIEIETGRGCKHGRCSFCLEPLKAREQFRSHESVVAEIKAFFKAGARYFRLGKQSCFYSHPEAAEMLYEIREQCPGIEVLHIDNVNPRLVCKKDHITKAILECCSAGNVAAFGVESFDPEVIRANRLNCNPEIAIEAIERLNQFGADYGPNGMPKFLPGINIIFGLNGESKKTHEKNMEALRTILDRGLLLRRINLRKVTILPGTELEAKCGNKYLRKNRKYYWRWREEIRKEIDFPMLGRLLPEGSVLKKVRAEIYSGKTTFGRQVGTYPLVIGVKERLKLKEFYNIRVKKQMLRSIVGEVV